MVPGYWPLMLCVVLLAGCASVPAVPRLAEPEVIRLADAEARKEGYDLRKFERPEAHYNYVERDDTWWVPYQGKAVDGMSWVGNHFSVTVEDKTKKLCLTPGR